jgi:dienelactone hydrolase
MIRTILAVAALAVAGAAQAKIQTKPMEYEQGGTKLQGFFAYDDAVKGKRPGVLVVHEWWGHNEHARNQAVRLAKAGYAAFALDMYGKGKVATHPEDAKAFMTEATKDPATVKARFDAGLAQLKRQPQVDPSKVAVVGYCMGGAIALSMARAGEELQAVSTFHAAMPPPDAPLAPGQVKPRILVNTGADDPMVPPAQVDAFVKQLKDAGAKVEVVSYPGVKHSFTNPDAGKAGMPALAYDKGADAQSGDATVKLFREVFGAKG